MSAATCGDTVGTQIPDIASLIRVTLVYFVAGKYASSQPRIMVHTRVDFSANRK
jgi:hypothetical protein